MIYFEFCRMVSSLEKRYLSSAGLSPLPTHFIASLKMSSKTITYSGYCHPLLPRQLHYNSSPKSPLCAYPLQKGSKILEKAPSKNTKFRKDMELSSLKKEREVPMILSKNSSKRGDSIKRPKNVSKSVSPFLPLPWTFVIP